jgi:hypothetical protein
MFLFLDKMEESIYRMSLTENLLVLIIIGLWLLAVINLARKLERICINPPTVYPNYSMHTKTNLSPSILRKRYSNDLLQPIRSSINPLVRATSEPTIDASPRTTILIRSPSETFVHAKLSISEQIPASDTLELGQSDSSFIFPSRSACQIHIETTSERPIIPQKLLYPRRIPSIVRRSLLDLHRRALMSNTSSNTFKPRYIVTKTENRSMVMTNIFPLMKKTYQRDNTIDDYEF